MLSRRFMLQAALPCAALLCAGQAIAQAYPSRPIRAIVPVAPGSATDLVARQAATALTRLWNGAPVVVDNRPGAGTVVGTEAVMRSPADGYTLLFNLSSFYTAPWLEKTAYDPVADFIPVARLAASDLFLVTAVDSPFKTVQDVVSAAKRAPGSVVFASAGDGTTSHMGGALLNAVAGIQMEHAPYKNGSQAMIETSNGQVAVAFSGPAALPLIKAGKLRVIATTGKKRSQQMPDVPAVNETPGLESYEVSSPVWAFAPKGTPAAIVNQLSEAFATVTAAQEFKNFCFAQSLEPDYQPAAAAGAQAGAEADKWRKMVQLTRRK